MIGIAVVIGASLFVRNSDRKRNLYEVKVMITDKNDNHYKAVIISVDAKPKKVTSKYGSSIPYYDFAEADKIKNTEVNFSSSEQYNINDYVEGEYYHNKFTPKKSSFRNSKNPRKY